MKFDRLNTIAWWYQHEQTVKLLLCYRIFGLSLICSSFVGSQKRHSKAQERSLRFLLSTNNHSECLIILQTSRRKVHVAEFNGNNCNTLSRLKEAKEVQGWMGRETGHVILEFQARMDISKMLQYCVDLLQLVI